MDLNAMQGVTSSSEDKKMDDNGGSSMVALCASCDRCRSRKTKCDGKRPCGNCASKYMKKHKLTSIDGIDLGEFECVYSPAKRRGPVPGRASGQTRKASEMNLSSLTSQNHLGGASSGGLLANGNGSGTTSSMQNAEFGVPASAPSSSSSHNNSAAAAAAAAAALMAGVDPQVAAFLQSHQHQQQQQQGSSGFNAASVLGAAGNNNGNANSTLQQQISLLQQQLQRQHQATGGSNVAAAAAAGAASVATGAEEPHARRMKMDESSAAAAAGPPGIPRTITAHTHLLERNDPEGARLLAYYRLSIDELYRLPPTPTDEEYCARLQQSTANGGSAAANPRVIPGSHLAALSAARLAELALGAIVHNEVSLGMELCNAVVHCLRESVQEPVQPTIMLEVAKAYFLLGVFRACRGDMTRYFKYRRVCMTYLSKLESDDKTATLLAAVSYLDSWAYMIYNANEKALPDIDDTIPCIQPVMNSAGFAHGTNEAKFAVKTDVPSIVSNPLNKNWIQGAPPVYLNNEAPLHARSLDALSCAVRTCCDQANGRFAAIAKEAGGAAAEGINCSIPQETIITPTTTAVLSHENELCSRNMVLSAYALMQQSETASRGKHRNEGQHLVISAMDAFLENSDEAGSAGFTDSQIQSLLSVCNTAVENPFLLHHAGPTYHMVSNAAVLLCHLLNGMHAMKASGAQSFGPMEATMFEEVMDTFIAVRKLLVIHRRKLPVKLRCHGIPRPSSAAMFEAGNIPEGQPVVDLGETLLCPCRGCQGFVLMACSPCVAAERAQTAATRLEVEAAQEATAVEMGELDRELDDLGTEFDVDDDALLNMISNLISS